MAKNLYDGPLRIIHVNLIGERRAVSKERFLAFGRLSTDLFNESQETVPGHTMSPTALAGGDDLHTPSFSIADRCDCLLQPPH